MRKALFCNDDALSVLVRAPLVNRWCAYPPLLARVASPGKCGATDR
jgi:hypothetical protein